MRPHLPLIVCMLGALAPAFAEPLVQVVVQHSALAGFRHYAGRSIWNDMKVGDPLALVRDVDNPHDAHAVRVEWRGHPIGYVPRRENSHLARQLDRGAQLAGRITRLEKSRNGRNRVSYEVFVPLDQAAPFRR
ncbi:MAG TPA: HIRAN domain-containing protein [Burkholderiales bacterium]|nr:HIRAN domain-containing protein [Burkholderiales bacterium]